MIYMLDVYFGGEDDITRAVAKRLICRTIDEKEVNLIELSSRASGHRALQNMPKIVNLGFKAPVITVFDTDNQCILEMLKTHAPDGWHSDLCAINLAVDEAESWLLADRKNIADFLSVDISAIPEKRKNDVELSNAIPYKTSMYIVKEIAPKSSDTSIKTGLYPANRFSKPPTYNTTLLPFVMYRWNIDEALINSKSLLRASQKVEVVLRRAIGSEKNK